MKSKAGRLTLRILVTVAVLLAIVVAAIWYEFLVTRGATPPIAGDNSVASLQEIDLGGRKQWVLIRGHDATKPVILFLHGGPGMPSMFLAHAFQAELEKNFIVVHWDRRGAGKSYDPADSVTTISVSQTLSDTFQLTLVLEQRFPGNTLYLIGHSWGSYLGLLAIRDHPEYYDAFVGMGQIAGSRPSADSLRRDFVASAARQAGELDFADAVQAGDQDITETDLFRFGGELWAADSFWPILKTGLMAPEYTLWDALNVKKGVDFVDSHMIYDVEPRPLEGEITEFEVPIFFFLGRHDFNTPSQLAANYLDRVSAPYKQVVWFNESAHFPFFEEPDRFNREMIALDELILAR